MLFGVALGWPQFGFEGPGFVEKNSTIYRKTQATEFYLYVYAEAVVFDEREGCHHAKADAGAWQLSNTASMAFVQSAVRVGHTPIGLSKISVSIFDRAVFEK